VVEKDPPLGSYEWYAAHPQMLRTMGIALPELPPLVSWKKLSTEGWRLMRGGWWLEPGGEYRGLR